MEHWITILETYEILLDKLYVYWQYVCTYKVSLLNLNILPIDREIDTPIALNTLDDW